MHAIAGMGHTNPAIRERIAREWIEKLQSVELIDDDPAAVEEALERAAGVIIAVVLELRRNPDLAKP